ncbi:MAG: sensor domain-containing diguanylate cyclase [Oceanospirillaceae bacterium]
MEDTSNFDADNWLLDNPNDLISIDKWQQTVNLLAKLFDAPAGFLVQHTLDGYQVTIASEQSSNPYSAGTVIEPQTNIFCRKIIETRKPLYVANATVDSYWDTNPEVTNDGFVSYLGVPVFWPNGKPFGTFCVMDFKVTHYEQTYVDLIHQLKDILESDLSLIEMYQQVQKLAVTDALTSIHNRRGFEILAQQRLHLAKRIDNSLSLFYFDVDQFKRINDQYGHTVGDDVLKIVAEALQESTCKADVIGRMGGDEFVALVSAKNADESAKILNGFNQNIVNKQKNTSTPVFSVTAGFTAVDLALEIKDIIQIADEEMLINKKLSR